MAMQEEARKGIIAICAAHKGEPSPLMPILEEIQKKYGYIPLEVQELVSKETGVPVSEIYGVVTFYNFFSLTPKGKYVIGVCLGTACYVKGSGEIYSKLKDLLDVEDGGCTPDGKFSLDACRCMGACGLAPVMSINDDVYGKVTLDQLPGILKKCN